MIVLFLFICYLFEISDAFSTVRIGKFRSYSVKYKSNYNNIISLNARVALTREEGSNNKVIDILKQKNIDFIELPCIAFAPGKDEHLLGEQMKKCDIIILSSPQAASVFISNWKKSGMPNVKVASIGKGTSKPLQSVGINPFFEPSDSTAETLAKELPKDSGNKILYPTSILAENLMQMELEKRGFEVIRLNTYETIEAPWTSENLEDAKDVEIVAFASPSAVKTWASRCGTNYVAVTIGPTSAKAASNFKEVISPKGSKGIEAFAELIIKTVDEYDYGVC